MSLSACGVDVFVRDVGTGEPVLFLHGNPDSADLWDGVIDRMRDRYRCIAIDLPGFGRSIAPRDFDCSPQNVARFMNEVVDWLGITQPINVVAHDFGGAFQMAWAIEHPERVRRIVVINHCAFVRDMKWHAQAKIWRTPLLGELSLLWIPRRAFLSAMRRASRMSDAQIRHIYDMLSPQWKWMVLRLYRSMDPSDFEQWAGPTLEVTSKVPTLVLWGEQDAYLASSMADKFGARRVVRFPNASHWLPVEEPERVAEELTRFFETD